jgi:Ca2+-binding RTX toxin-like protein
MTTIGSSAPWPSVVALVGTDEADEVRIRKLADNVYELDFNGDILELGGQQLAALRFDLRGGDDRFMADEDVDVALWVYGGEGEDFIQGGAGNDALRGGDDDDVVLGGAGDDHLWGGGGNDALYGGDGYDALSDVYGRNRMDGGAGNDQMLVGADMGRPPEAWQNDLVDFDDLMDARANGGWTQDVRATKTAAPYDAPSWCLQSFLPLPASRDAAARRASDDSSDRAEPER